MHSVKVLMTDALMVRILNSACAHFQSGQSLSCLLPYPLLLLFQGSHMAMGPAFCSREEKKGPSQRGRDSKTPFRSWRLVHSVQGIHNLLGKLDDESMASVDFV